MRIAVTLAILLLGAAGSAAQVPPDRPLPEPQLHDFASQLLRDKGKARCKPPNCRILVADFTLASGDTSHLGMLLADQIAKDCASLLDPSQVIDRAQLRHYLDQARIPASFLVSDEALRWLAKQLSATTILAGTTLNHDGKLFLTARLVSGASAWSGKYEDLTLPYDGDLPADLASIDPYPERIPSSGVTPPPGVFVAGKNGVTNPTCQYCPPPAFTPAARAAKFQGVVLLTVVVSPEGRIINAVPLRGLPFDLTESAISEVAKWHLVPATKDGQPVSVATPIEVTYRFY